MVNTNDQTNAIVYGMFVEIVDTGLWLRFVIIDPSFAKEALVSFWSMLEGFR